MLLPLTPVRMIVLDLAFTTDLPFSGASDSEDFTYFFERGCSSQAPYARHIPSARGCLEPQNFLLLKRSATCLATVATDVPLASFREDHVFTEKATLICSVWR